MPSEWAEGGILQGSGCYSIIYGWTGDDPHIGNDIDRHIVYSDTVGQYTGMTDKNGKRIFEGDIICVEFTKDTMPGELPQKWYDTACIHFSEDYHGWYAVFGEDEESMLEYDDPSCVEIVGNIYDNPELIEVHNFKR